MKKNKITLCLFLVLFINTIGFSLDITSSFFDGCMSTKTYKDFVQFMNNKGFKENKEFQYIFVFKDETSKELFFTETKMPCYAFSEINFHPITEEKTYHNVSFLLKAENKALIQNSLIDNNFIAETKELPMFFAEEEILYSIFNENIPHILLDNESCNFKFFTKNNFDYGIGITQIPGTDYLLIHILQKDEANNFD